MKSGPAITAVMTPTGISAGLVRSLPRVSASMSVTEPVSAERKSSFLFSAPVKYLAICGAISPTNPIVPPTETTVPLSGSSSAEVLSWSLPYLLQGWRLILLQRTSCSALSRSNTG